MPVTRRERAASGVFCREKDVNASVNAGVGLSMRGVRAFATLEI